MGDRSTLRRVYASLNITPTSTSFVIGSALWGLEQRVDSLGITAWDFWHGNSALYQLSQISHCSCPAQILRMHVCPMRTLRLIIWLLVVVWWSRLARRPGQAHTEIKTVTWLPSRRLTFPPHLWIADPNATACLYFHLTAISHHRSHIEKDKSNRSRSLLDVSPQRRMQVFRHLGAIKGITYSSCLLYMKNGRWFLIFLREIVLSTC